MGKNIKTILSTAIFLLSLSFTTSIYLAEASEIPGTVASRQKISDTQGNFLGYLQDYYQFAWDVVSIGDLDGDGVTDLAVGDSNDGDGGTMHGAVWILFMNTNGTVKSYQKISDTQGNFTGNLDYEDSFGISVASIGDLNGDGITDLAVGACYDDDGGTDHGAVWILFMNTNGTVASHQKISDTQGNFTGNLDNGDWFGISVASIGDLDGDGVTDLAVGAPNDDDGGPYTGAVWVLFMCGEEEEPEPTNAVVYGDVAPLGNPDGVVNVGDALIALRFALGLEPGHPTSNELTHGDIAPLDSNECPNPDGKLNVADALIVLRLALGLVDFSHCTPTTTKLTISLTGVPAGTTLGALDLTMDYDESKVTFNSVAAGTLTPGATIIPNDNGDTVRVGLVQAAGFDGGASGSIMVFTFDINQPNIPSSGDFIVTDFLATDLMASDAGLNIYDINFNIVNQ